MNTNMMFSNLAAGLAALVFLLGIVLVFAGFTGDVEKYWPGRTPGQIIDKGIYYIVFSVALGTLAEISFSLRNIRNKE